MPIPGKWITSLTACFVMVAVTYFELDPGTVIWQGLRIFFKLAIVGVSLQFVVTRVYERFIKPRHIQEKTDSLDWCNQDRVFRCVTDQTCECFGDGSQRDSNVEEENRERIKQNREELQAGHHEKTSSFKERILIPREEAKRRKKEEKFIQFCGPAWKGHGEKLGGEDVRDGERSNNQAGKEARDIRKLPDTVLLHVPHSEPKRTKRVINLPDEPCNADTADVVTIILRTPLGTSHKRRFLTSCTVQVVFDYMTTLGFKEKLFTLATSYPRRLLTDSVDRTIHDLGFYKQVILYIEEL